MADAGTKLYLHLLVTTTGKRWASFLWVFFVEGLFQSPFLFSDGFVLQGCSLLLVALGAMGDSPVLLTTVDFLLVGCLLLLLCPFSFLLTGITNPEPGPWVSKNTATFHAPCQP